MNDNKATDAAELPPLPEPAISSYELVQQGSGIRRIDYQTYSADQMKEYALAVRTLSASEAPGVPETRTAIPLAEIGSILNEVMECAVKNGANSVSMPDEYVAVAHFLSFPEKYAAAPSSPALDEAKVREALKPFAEAYRSEAERLEKSGATAEMQEFLDRNRITPPMTMGDFRRAYEALFAPASPVSAGKEQA